MAKVDLIKKANVEEEYSLDKLDELARCEERTISEDEGIIYFIRKYVHIQHPTQGEIPFDLYPYQVRMLDNYLNNRWAITLTARQSGKTETSAAYLLWRAIFTKDQNILVASRRGSDAKDIMKRIKFMYESLPGWLKPGIKEYNVHTISFDNGSEIYAEATTENTGRGRSISLLYLDEFAFVKPRIADEFWASILPTLSTGGDCIITSTPNGDADQFSTLWHGAIMDQQNGFSPVEVTWREVPGRDDKFRAETIAKIGELKWRREYNNEFLSADEILINATRLQAIKPVDPDYIRNGFKFWKTPKRGEVYVIGVDVGTGTGSDYSTIQCFSFPKLEQVAEFRDNMLTTPEFTKRLIWLLMLLDKTGAEIYYSFESNGVGEGVYAAMTQYEDIKNVELPGNMIHDIGKNKRGLATTNKSKIAACMDLKSLVDTDNPKMTIKSKALLTELKFYVRKGAGFEAKLGITDDLIAALLVTIRVSNEISIFEDADYSTYDMDDDYDDDSVYGIVF